MKHSQICRGVELTPVIPAAEIGLLYPSICKRCGALVDNFGYVMDAQAVENWVDGVVERNMKSRLAAVQSSVTASEVRR